MQRITLCEYQKKRNTCTLTRKKLAVNGVRVCTWMHTVLTCIDPFLRIWFSWYTVQFSWCSVRFPWYLFPWYLFPWYLVLVHVSCFHGIISNANVEVSTNLLACWCKWYERCTPYSYTLEGVGKLEAFFTKHCIYSLYDHVPFFDLQDNVLPWEPSLLDQNQINQVSQCSNLPPCLQLIWLGPSKKTMSMCCWQCYHSNC